jgi:hypothetical protein
MKEIILNKLRYSTMTTLDVIFLGKRYIGNMPNMIYYEKLLDDVDAVLRGKYQDTGDLKTICDYIRKACVLNRNTLDLHFAKFKTMRDTISQPEFEKAVSDLGIISEICTIL